MEFYSQQPLHFYTQSEEPTGNGQAHGQVHCNKNPSLSVYKVLDNNCRGICVVYTLQERENQDYDVSPYRVKDSAFYENPKVVIDEEDLKEFAGSRLEKITSSTGTDYAGTYRNHEFTIVRADCFAK